MKLLRGLLAELFGLFVDDELLAIGALVVVAAAAALVALLPATPLVAAAVLLLGAIGVLVVSVLRRAGRRR